MELKAQVVIPGTARGPVLRFDEPISFWGGVDPSTGRFSDPRGPHHRESLAGAVLVLPETRGSSSSSAIMLELLARNIAPAAIIVGRVDAILGLGIIVARELGYRTIPFLQLDRTQQARLATGDVAAISEDGTIRVA